MPRRRRRAPVAEVVRIGVVRATAIRTTSAIASAIRAVTRDQMATCLLRALDLAVTDGVAGPVR